MSDPRAAIERHLRHVSSDRDFDMDHEELRAALALIPEAAVLVTEASLLLAMAEATDPDWGLPIDMEEAATAIFARLREGA